MTGSRRPCLEFLGLIEEILEARTGAPAQNPALTPLEVTPDPMITSVPDEQLREFVGGTGPYPPAPTGEQPRPPSGSPWGTATW